MSVEAPGNLAIIDWFRKLLVCSAEFSCRHILKGFTVWVEGPVIVIILMLDRTPKRGRKGGGVVLWEWRRILVAGERGGVVVGRWVGHCDYLARRNLVEGEKKLMFASGSEGEFLRSWTCASFIVRYSNRLFTIHELRVGRVTSPAGIVANPIQNIIDMVRCQDNAMGKANPGTCEPERVESALVLLLPF